MRTGMEQSRALGAAAACRDNSRENRVGQKTKCRDKTQGQTSLAHNYQNIESMSKRTAS